MQHSADYGETLGEADSRTADYTSRIADLEGQMQGLVDDFNAGAISEEEFAERSGRVNEEIAATNNLLNQEVDGLESSTSPIAKTSNLRGSSLMNMAGFRSG